MSEEVQQSTDTNEQTTPKKLSVVRFSTISAMDFAEMNRQNKLKDNTLYFVDNGKLYKGNKIYAGKDGVSALTVDIVSNGGTMLSPAITKVVLRAIVKYGSEVVNHKINNAAYRWAYCEFDENGVITSETTIPSATSERLEINRDNLKFKKGTVYRCYVNVDVDSLLD